MLSLVDFFTSKRNDVSQYTTPQTVWIQDTDATRSKMHGVHRSIDCSSARAILRLRLRDRSYLGRLASCRWRRSVGLRLRATASCSCCLTLWLRSLSVQSSFQSKLRGSLHCRLPESISSTHGISRPAYTASVTCHHIDRQLCDPDPRGSVPHQRGSAFSPSRQTRPTWRDRRFGNAETPVNWR